MPYLPRWSRRWPHGDRVTVLRHGRRVQLYFQFPDPDGMLVGYYVTLSDDDVRTMAHALIG